MRLRELEIKNFGCIGSKGLRIVIDEIIVLIGPNNVGKSTVLKAYQTFESGNKSTLREEDFYEYDCSTPIEIIGTFCDISEEDKIQIGEKWIFDNIDYGDCISYKYVWDKPNVKGSKFSYNHNDDDWEAGGMGGWDTKIASCIPSSLCVNPLDDPGALEGAIIEILANAVKQNAQTEESKIKNLIDDLNKIAEDIQEEIKEDIESTTNEIEKNIENVFPSVKVSLKSQAGNFQVEKVIASGSHLRISDESGKEYPLGNQGSGLQRAFLWSAIQALAENGRLKKGRTQLKSEKPKILLVEEPESFLHPPAIRNAREALYNIAQLAGWQVMITTHSPIFIDVSKPHTTIIRIEKSDKGETKSFSTNKASFDENDRDRLKMIRNCNPEVNEFFFSNKIILVEGETEQSIFNELKSNPEIHIVNCYGKANIPTFQKILNHFSVEYIVLHDTDFPQVKRNEKKITNSMWTMNKKIFEESNKNENNLVIASVPDLEQCFFGKLQKGDKPYQALKKIQDTDFIKSNEFKVLEEIANFNIAELKESEYVIKKIEDYQTKFDNYDATSDLGEE
ncbi:AAA family ATPase [Enterococcus hulanensis]|uniref:ATP-dependent nuclease n=1 Tax=Enterococcus hulanensis TaxID=2559929 RepID=UPI001A935CBC|nr:AAA family ATPase [Enterococcus hulanensis]MBO0409599.1 AAA family ATPase [Enterococcus hulanensis]